MSAVVAHCNLSRVHRNQELRRLDGKIAKTDVEEAQKTEGMPQRQGIEHVNGKELLPRRERSHEGLDT
jgi:hypothetical protein